ncbi:unnamed protein product [Arctogadus glacialis]
MAPTCVCDFSRYGVLNRPEHTKPVMYCTYVDECDWVVNRISGEIWRYLVRSWSAFKSQMWRQQGYLTEKTLRSHLSFIEWTHWFANDQRCSHRQIAAWHSPLIQIVEVEAVFLVVTCHNTVMCFMKKPPVTFKLS